MLPRMFPECEAARRGQGRPASASITGSGLLAALGGSLFVRRLSLRGEDLVPLIRRDFGLLHLLHEAVGGLLIAHHAGDFAKPAGLGCHQELTIATEMGKTEGAVRTMLSRALAQLAEVLESEDSGEKPARPADDAG